MRLPPFRNRCCPYAAERDVSNIIANQFITECRPVNCARSTALFVDKLCVYIIMGRGKMETRTSWEKKTKMRKIKDALIDEY